MFANSYYVDVQQIYTPTEILYGHSVLVCDGVIEQITPEKQPGIPVVSAKTSSLVPGLIDMHIHGREGCDVMDAKMSSIETISTSLAKHGVTGFLATTVTASWQQSIKAFEIIGEAAAKEMPGAEVLGAYNEGLFFTETHKGAHNDAFFLKLTKERVDQIYRATNGKLKVIALAPEFQDSVDIIEYIKSLGVNVMIGHTNANYQQTADALAAGACGGVHIFNGMSGIHHRDPGCAGAVLMDKQALAEVIADGVHLHPVIMQMVYRMKGQEKIALISDCINAGGFPDGEYRLGELNVKVVDGIARTASGSLAGSTLTLEKSVKNMNELADVPLLEAINMASLVPAKHLGLGQSHGSIEVGKQANFAIWDKSLNVQATFIKGKLVYREPSFSV